MGDITRADVSMSVEGFATDDAAIVIVTVAGIPFDGTAKRHPHDPPYQDAGLYLALARALSQAAAHFYDVGQERVDANCVRPSYVPAEQAYRDVSEFPDAFAEVIKLRSARRDL